MKQPVKSQTGQSNINTQIHMLLNDYTLVNVQWYIECSISLWHQETGPFLIFRAWYFNRYMHFRSCCPVDLSWRNWSEFKMVAEITSRWSLNKQSLYYIDIQMGHSLKLGATELAFMWHKWWKLLSINHSTAIFLPRLQSCWWNTDPSSRDKH